MSGEDRPVTVSPPTGRVALDDFTLIKVIGKGTYGKVMLVRHKKDNAVYAMKMLRKEHVVKRNQVEHTKTERNVLEAVSHPFIVKLMYAFQTPKKLYFILEYCPGGELFFHLSRAARFSEERCRFYATEILLAIEYLHAHDIVYRDLKPENVLLNGEGHVKLTDFGLSKEGISDNFSAKSICGTPEYLAPEILDRHGHGKAVDWYSFGALIYEMLTGLPPYYTKDREKLFERIRRGDLQFPSYVSQNARSLLEGLLRRDPFTRLGSSPLDADEIKIHPFFQGVDWKAVYELRTNPPFKPKVTSQTDVKYFDREFVDMPTINSLEVPSGVLKNDDQNFATNQLYVSDISPGVGGGSGISAANVSSGGLTSTHLPAYVPPASSTVALNFEGFTYVPPSALESNSPIANSADALRASFDNFDSNDSFYVYDGRAVNQAAARNTKPPVMTTSSSSHIPGF